MTELYLIRHGETPMNQRGVYYGWTDCSLNEKGLEQAEELAGILREVEFDIVIASNLKRAVDTAVVVSGFSPGDIILEERLRELNFGKWEGMHFSDVQEKYRECWEQWCSDWKYSAPPSGESFMDMYHRIKCCIEELLDRYKGKKMLIVSHQGPMRIIPLVLLKLPFECYWSFTAEQGRYSHYQIDEKGCCIIKRINSRR